MLCVSQIQHPPAYATTVLVGETISRVRRLLVFVITVLVVVGVHETLGRRTSIRDLRIGSPDGRTPVEEVDEGVPSLLLARSMALRAREVSTRGPEPPCRLGGYGD